MKNIGWSTKARYCYNASRRLLIIASFHLWSPSGWKSRSLKDGVSTEKTFSLQMDRFPLCERVSINVSHVIDAKSASIRIKCNNRMFNDLIAFINGERMWLYSLEWQILKIDIILDRNYHWSKASDGLNELPFLFQGTEFIRFQISGFSSNFHLW